MNTPARCCAESALTTGVAAGGLTLTGRVAVQREWSVDLCAKGQSQAFDHHRKQFHVLDIGRSSAVG